MEDRKIQNAQYYKSHHFSEKKTQCEMTLEYMKMFDSITPLEALTAFNCLRLGARLSNLREAGYNITTTIAKGKKKYAIYRLEENNE